MYVISRVLKSENFVPVEAIVYNLRADSVSKYIFPAKSLRRTLAQHFGS